VARTEGFGGLAVFRCSVGREGGMTPEFTSGSLIIRMRWGRAEANSDGAGTYRRKSDHSTEQPATITKPAPRSTPQSSSVLLLPSTIPEALESYDRFPNPTKVLGLPSSSISIPESDLSRLVSSPVIIPHIRLQFRTPASRSRFFIRSKYPLSK